MCRSCFANLFIVSPIVVRIPQLVKLDSENAPTLTHAPDFRGRGAPRKPLMVSDCGAESLPGRAVHLLDHSLAGCGF
ncbi:hypothetical protein PROAA_2630009 [Candidatus Propionivibrio aalborgensis]|uniref:Uncharacterized protein n=1 Tax=Candidatus Propionivibrio aalborgensis TaxID=1860101 RepID=A0A1A8XT52_9RHOO|nr:hypothetical protein PROAA_2630009 [Candidatus Propionivibrio aalborgensis]